MKKTVIFLLLLFFLVGCSFKYMEFSGESKSWEGKYSANIYGNDEDGNYTFFYKNGDGNTILENIEIIVGTGINESKLYSEEHQGATFTMKSSCQNCSITQENEKIEVTIKWDSQHEESFVLESK